MPIQCSDPFAPVADPPARVTPDDDSPYLGIRRILL
jgi:hypothetical protein